LGRSVQQGALCAPVPLVRRFHGVSVCVGWVCRSGDGGGVPGGASRGRACARREALGRKGFRAARWGGKGVRLQCSLRPGPAGARWLGWRWGCAGGGAVVEEGARLLRRFHGVSVCGGWVCRSGDGAVCLVGLRGVGPALAGRLWGGKAFALRAEEERVFASNARSDPAPRAPGGWGGAGVGASVEEGDLGLRGF
jgi:hypothetical protein